MFTAHLRSAARRAGALVLVTGMLLVPCASSAQPCSGDCDADGQVSIDEIVRGVNIALGSLGVEACASLDANGDGEVTVDELISAVGWALNGCPAPTVSGSSSLASGVVVLDAATAAQIVTADSTSITFAGAPSTVTALHPGDVFIAQNTARKVVSISSQNGNTLVQSVEPQFSEVFRMLQLAGTIALSDQDVVRSASLQARLEKRSTAAASQGNSYTITVTDSLLHGTVVLEQPQIDLDFNFGAISTDPQNPNQYASIHFRTGETVDLNLSAAISSSVSQDIELLEFKRAIPVTFGAVEISVVLTLHLAADGSAQLITGIHQGLAYDAGMTAILNPLVVTPKNQTTHAFQVIAPQFTGAVHAVVAVDPDVDVEILQYPLAGITNSLGVDATAKATGDASNGCFRLQADAELSSGAFVLLPKVALQANIGWDTFFSGDISMQRYPLGLFQIKEPIYDSGDQCLLPSPSPSPTPTEPAPSPTGGMGATPSPTATTEMPPPSPTGVAATAADGQVTLKWNDVSGATSYNVYVATVSGVNPMNFDTLPGGERHTGVESPFLDSGLTDGTTYYFVVTAQNDAGESAPSAEVAATPHMPSSGGHSSIASNDRHTCVVLADGGVSCWGDGAFGDLGDGSFGPSTPVRVSGISTATMVAAGAGFSCALLADGTVRCWGSNVDGVLGRDYPAFASSATPVTVAAISNAIGLAAGYHHVCVLLDDGTIQCWGSNFSGELGSGMVGGTSAAPVTVGGVSGATAVAAGGNDTCALLAGGTVRCWGNNASGQLGKSTSMTGIDCFTLACPPSPVPLEVTGLSTAIAISVGDASSCALLGDGTVGCWGGGFLGRKNVPHGQSLTPVMVEGIASASLVAAGADHSCADSDGALYCWGMDNNGQLGDGGLSGTPADTPVMVQGLAGVSAAASGYLHTCAVSFGTVYCWGSNLQLQLGVGASNDPYSSNVPLTVIANAR